jgi:uncharacterized protein YraI
MTTLSNQPESSHQANDSEDDPHVFAVSKNLNDGFIFSRRNFLELAAASATALAVVASKAAKADDEDNTQSVHTEDVLAVNLYTGPGYKYEVVDPAGEGEYVKLVGHNNDHSWIQVQTESGTTGWLSSEFLDLNKADHRPGSNTTGSEGGETAAPMSTTEPYEIYLPIVIKQPTPTPTPTQTSTPTQTPDPCSCDKICTCDTIHYWYPN